MENCELCLTNKPDKKNTHYLTDGIIRSCLNLEGSTEREKGFYFDISNDSAFVEFNFQRGTSVEKLEEALGRQTTESEIENAKTIPFSVDYVFCSSCETKFTQIETEFIENILPQLRGKNLENLESIRFDNTKNLRAFFIIQISRSHICEPTYKLNSETAEKLRTLIFEYPNIDETLISEFPISINYLETLGGQEEFTTNYVGYTNDKNPFIIFMNDFLIQFFENINSFKFLDFYGINKVDNFENEVNYKEKTFQINILHQTERREFLRTLITNEKVKSTLNYYIDSFNKLWQRLFGTNAPTQTTKEYIALIIGQDENNILNYTRENILELTTKFIYSKIK